MTDGSRAKQILADKPDLESALEDVLAVDETHETWTFDDLSIDSGAFGHLVSEGVVEKVDGEYRLADPDAVRRALDGESTTVPDSGATDSSVDFSVSLPQIDVRAAGLLGSVVALLVVSRSFMFGSIFRGEHVVLSANDPYYYLYWVEQALVDGGIGLLPFGEVPDGITTGEPFLVATLTWLAGLFGGASGAVLAVYPVLAAAVVGLALYGLTLHVTDDRRVALAAVLMLAITPTNALRTSLGFADHHAFDYVWLTLTAFALAVLVRTDRRDTGRRWLAALGLGIGLSGQVLAWDNGPLLVVPVAGVLALRVLLDVRDGHAPLERNLPILAGLGFAAIVTFAAHALVGWHSQTVALTPALLLAGSVGLVGVGELTARLGRDVRELAVFELLTGVLTIAAVRTLFPDYWDRLLTGIERITRQDAIVEVRSLLDVGVVDFLFYFGFVLFLALPVLVWASVRFLSGRDRWLVPCVYGWYFFLLSLFQVRFTGELSPFLALFAGMAFVWIAAWVDLTDTPAPLSGDDLTGWLPDSPDRSTVFAVVLLFLLVGGFSAVESGLRVSQMPTDDASYQTAAWLEDYADEQGWDTAEESYVLSGWGDNRMYNYFVNGQSQSYGYARQTYSPFIETGDPEEASNMLGSRVRFVVTTDVQRAQPQTMQARLHDHFGSRHDDISGVANFRAVFASESEARKAFVHVPGARLSGTAAPNSTVDITTDVDIPGASFTYERQVETNTTGAFSVTVPYPGDYNLTAGEDSWTVSAPEQAVRNGTTVAADP